MESMKGKSVAIHQEKFPNLSFHNIKGKASDSTKSNFHNNNRHDSGL